METGMKNNKKLIIVDIQPIYSKNIDFDMTEFIKYLKEFDQVLYFYNGEDLCCDSEYQVKEWLIEHGMDYDDFHSGITFIEKMYGNLRGRMEDMDEEDIVNLLKYMIDEGYNDSRDITDNKIIKKYELWKSDSISLPSHFDIDDLIGFEDAYLIGGAKNECLLEFELFLRAHDFSYKYNHDFIY